MLVGKTFVFDSSHYIEGHPTCGDNHGHTWTLTVMIDGAVQPNGMVLDFHVLGLVVRELLKLIDHKMINRALAHDKWFQDKPITAETLCQWFVHNIKAKLNSMAILYMGTIGCRLQEGQGGWAEYWEE